MPGGLQGWTRSSWPNSNTEYTEGGSRCRQPGWNRETQSKHVEMWLGKSKPSWSWIWPSMSKTTRNASISIEVTKGRPWKMWPCCWTGHGTWKRLRYQMPYLHQPLLARPVFRNSRSKMSVEESGTRKRPLRRLRVGQNLRQSTTVPS